MAAPGTPKACVMPSFSRTNTAAIAAFIVVVMKGPAYVADAYPLNDSDTPSCKR